MNWRKVIGRIALGVLLIPATSRAASPLTIYDDQLRNGFADWSWAAHSMAQATVVHGGAAAMSFVPAAWQALYLETPSGLFTGTYDAVEFWVNGGPSGQQAVKFSFVDVGGNVLGSSAPLSGFVTGGSIPAGSWAKARVPFASLGLDTATTVYGIWLQANGNGTQPTVYVDDVVATAWATAPPPPPPGQTVTVAVDPSLDRRPVNPLVYGVNFGSAAQALRIHWPLRRWGGNSTTRYSWQDDISNHAMDWFFYNIEEGNSNPAALPDGSAADRFVDETRAGGGDALVTVPLIGWTPIDRVRRWGFSVAKYGAQQQTECTASGNAAWCQPDAGNGLKPDGSAITGNDPHDTSRPIGPSFVTGWMGHISGRTGNAAQGGVRFWALDNEPMLWNSTHRDVHPDGTSYDELWAKTLGMAVAMKTQDPGALLFGPALWGWCAYFYSGADGCQAGADAAAHGNVPFLQWYLAQAAGYEALHGIRLVDYADIHYYPQSNGVALSSDESAPTSALRLRSLKSLYDPSYVDESWIAQPIRLIPRMREWIAARYPGTKLAITEYSWGNDDGISSALAHAEALAIFGREGVDAATRWTSPADGSLVEDAFLLYLDYDGAGSRASGSSVRAVSSDVDAVGSYAIQAPSGRLFLLLFNKDTVARPVAATVAGGGSAPVRLFSFDGANRLHAAGTASVASGALSLTLPARSATLAEIGLAVAGSGLHLVTPCRVVDTRSPATYPVSGTALAAGESRSFAVPSSTCGLPPDAVAYSLNVTAVPPGPLGYLTLWPSGQARPITSTLNSPNGRIRANFAIVPAGAAGAVSAYATDATDLVVDVNGWFGP